MEEGVAEEYVQEFSSLSLSALSVTTKEESQDAHGTATSEVPTLSDVTVNAESGDDGDKLCQEGEDAEDSTRSNDTTSPSHSEGRTSLNLLCISSLDE